MNGNSPQELELINIKKELEQMRIRINNSKHQLKMMEAMEKKLTELARGS